MAEKKGKRMGGDYVGSRLRIVQRAIEKRNRDRFIALQRKSNEAKVDVVKR